MATTSPNSGDVAGLNAAKAAFKALPDIARDRMLAATETTVREIVRNAQARLERSPSIQTRNLFNHVAWSISKATGRGRVGISAGSTTISNIATRTRVRIKGIVRQDSSGRQTIDKPSRRAHFIEFGTRHMPAEPFMIPAAEGEKANYLDRAKRAGRDIERDMANVGSRGF